MIISNQMSNKTNIKNSIARKLTLRVSVALFAALMLLLAGALFALNREVRLESEFYAKSIVGIYSDVSAYSIDSPVKSSFTERTSFVGDYLCQWYRVDYLYTYIPDIDNNTVTFVSVTKNGKKYGDGADDHMEGVTVSHVMSEREIKAWNDITYAAIEKRGLIDSKATEVEVSFIDQTGERAMAGVSVSTERLQDSMMRGFLIVSLFMFVILGLLAIFISRFIRHNVSDPAQRISKSMSEYISGGKRSAIQLKTDSDDEFSMMADAFNHMTGEMDKYIDDIALLGREKERQQAEEDIASQIQQGILPAGLASMGNCGIKAVMKPARNIGGDLYDYQELDSSHTMIVIADVSGKGISSAMLMAMTLTLIRQFAKLGYSPAAILKNVNDTLSEENPRLMFVTAFIGIYDSDNDTLTYANAGHNPPYLIHEVPKILEGSDGTPLGLFSGEEYTDVTVRMEVDDSVFLYTDGVNEAVNKDGEFYGTDRLEQVLAEVAKTENRYNVEAVQASLREFVGDTEQSDDITMLSMRAMRIPVIELNYDIREFQIIRDKILSSDLPAKMAMDLCVAAEEIFVNICSYAFDGPVPDGEKIQFSFEFSKKVIMRFSDGGRPFDPRCGLPDTEEYDIDSAVGGLGRLIAFTIADSVDYEYKAGRNILTITKSKNQ